MCGLVCLLPHGYEGQGPEHSSARLERFLQMCAQDNMQVVNCTTPANYFHALRRQMHRDFRKPLIVMTPKSLLRHKRAVSYFKDMGPNTSFHRILHDGAEVPECKAEVTLKADKEIRRVVMCSGKVYFDLFEEREKRKIDDVYLLRIEQLYPFPVASLMKELARFPQADMVWCQEEPRNMGSWNFVDWNIEKTLEKLDVKHKRAALCRPPRFRLHRRGHDDAAQQGARSLPGCSVREVGHPGGRAMAAFSFDTRDEASAFHALALRLGARTEGDPGERGPAGG